MGVLKAKRNGQLVAYRLDKAAVIVGSGEACNIRVPDAGLVTRHCQILKMENGYVLRDMSGEVGTFVNGKKVKEHLLSDRDLIQVGKERFTFSVSAGENTSRVAVSVAPAVATPAAKTGATTRAVAASSGSGSTGRIASPPPAVERKTGRVDAVRPPTSRMQPPAAVEAPGRSTQRVSKGNTDRVQKTTGRVQGATKKITARSAAQMGYQTSRSTFAMPSTRKGKLIAIGAVLFIIALGGVMYLIKASQINPEKEKETMLTRVREIDKKFKPEQVAEKDQALEQILQDYEPVKKYVAQVFSDIEKIHNKIHPIAADLKKAQKEVNPFLNKYAQIKAKPEDLKAQAQTLYDECRSLKESHGMTVLGPQLEAIQAELMKILGDRGPSWTEKIVGLQSEVRAMAKKGEFTQANAKLNEFGETFKEKEELELFKKLTEQRDFLKRESLAFVNRKITETNKELAAEGAKKDEIKKKVEPLKAGLEGFKEALDKLETYIASTFK
ncbi:MAG TPA: FHA domain-containing protein [Planctomycetota bacterium]|nr:FHA domain-containing protein [Planctomycetota bacterium]